MSRQLEHVANAGDGQGETVELRLQRVHQLSRQDGGVADDRVAVYVPPHQQVIGQRSTGQVVAISAGSLEVAQLCRSVMKTGPVLGDRGEQAVQ